MIKKILDKILSKKLRGEVVSTVKIENSAYEYITDARSAAFYATGKAIKGKSMILIVNGYELQSVYTAITEAWFQKTDLWIVAIHKNIHDVNTNFLDRCLNKTVLIDNPEELNEIDELFNAPIGPKLINVLYDYNSIEKNDYLEIISKIKQVDSSIEIVTYNGDNVPCENIDQSHKYGVLSKYLGRTIVSKKNRVLICTADVFLLDLNIFNSRYITDKFKIVVCDEDNVMCKNNIDKWISSNNIAIYSGSDNIEELVINKVAGILVIGGAK